MKKIAISVLVCLSINANAANLNYRNSGQDSTGLSLSFINSNTQTTNNNYKNSHTVPITIPNREVHHHHYYPAEPTPQPQPQQPIQCTAYEYVQSDRYRLSSSNAESSEIAANVAGRERCGRLGQGTAPFGVYRNARQSNECLVGAWYVPVYTRICTEWR